MAKAIAIARQSRKKDKSISIKEQTSANLDYAKSNLPGIIPTVQVKKNQISQSTAL